MEDVIQQLQHDAHKASFAGDQEKKETLLEAVDVLKAHEAKKAIAKRRAANKAARKARRRRN